MLLPSLPSLSGLMPDQSTRTRIISAFSPNPDSPSWPPVAGQAIAVTMAVSIVQASLEILPLLVPHSSAYSERDIELWRDGSTAWAQACFQQ